MEMASLNVLRTIAEVEFSDIISFTSIIDDKLRVMLVDNSYIDFWWSYKFPERFAHHWERRHVDGTIYRHDNAPHKKWRYFSSFPQHFHFKSDSEVIESKLNPVSELSIREFLSFAPEILLEIS
jgi:hypothetical protein